MSVDATTSTGPMVNGRRADPARRRQRVLKALNDAVNAGEEMTVTDIARRSGVDCSFLYRHGDLLAQVHAMEAEPPNATGVGPAISRASLQTDLLNAQQRAVRLAARVQQLERRLSEALGERAWRESSPGSGRPPTSTSFNNESSSSNSTSSTSACSSKNAIRTSTPPGRPTVSS